MLDRRAVLRRGGSALGAAAVVGAAGCLSLGGDDGGDSGDGEPEETYLSPLPDTRPAVVPSFHAAYDYDVQALVESLDDVDAMPELGRNLLDIVADMPDIDPTGIDGLTGQTVRQVGHSGGDISLVTPQATDLVARGEIDADAAASWFEGNDNLDALGRHNGHRRYGNAGEVVEAFTVDDSTLTFGTRQGTDTDPETVSTAAIDALDDAPVPTETTSPPLFALVQALPGGEAQIATAFDLVAERPDTGNAAVDATAASLVGAGLTASIDGTRVVVTRLLRYRRDRVASPDDVSAAVERAVANGDFHDTEWEVSASDRTVRIEGDVPTTDLAETPARLRRAVPATGYADLTEPIDPAALGREAPPRVRWAPSRTDDGRFRIRHAGGPSVSDLVVAYTVDGERRREEWAGPVEQDDRFTIDAVPDGGTTLDLVWRPDTPDETILMRIGVRERS